MPDPHHELHAATAAISLCAVVLAPHRDLLERFMRESRYMENVGPVLAPSLFMSSERRAVESVMKPIYQAALDFLNAHERQVAAARGALDKVRDHG